MGQVRHYFSQNLSGALLKEERGIMKVIGSATESESFCKVTSKLYDGILQSKSKNTWYILEKWGKGQEF